MAQLDRLLPTMFAHPGTELLVAAHSEPQLRSETEHVVLVPRPLEPEHVRFLLGELLDASSREALEQTGTLDFVYAPAGHPRVSVSVRNWHEDAVFARLRAYAQGNELPTTGHTKGSLPMPIEGANALRPSQVEAHLAEVAAPQPSAPVLLASVKPQEELVPAPPEAPPAPATIALEPALPLAALLREVVKERASDLHLSTGQPPTMRRHGTLVRMDDRAAPSAADVMQQLRAVMPERNAEEFAVTGDTEFAYELAGVGRFRINAFRDQKGPCLVARAIPVELMADQFGIPSAVRHLTTLVKGLVLVTGPTGSGKSTTLSSLIDLINREREDHIITLENPIEFVHESKKSFVNQREVGVHTNDFTRALRAALREDPDVIMVGELTCPRTLLLTLEAADAGHLVFATMRTTTAVGTLERIIDQFADDRQAYVRAMLAESLRAIVGQTLCRKLGGGRVAALEVLLVTPAVASLIHEGKIAQIPGVMHNARKLGMILLNDALVSLVAAHKIEPKEAYARAIDKHGIVAGLAAAGHAYVPGMSSD